MLQGECKPGEPSMLGYPINLAHGTGLGICRLEPPLTILVSHLDVQLGYRADGILKYLFLKIFIVNSKD